MTKMQAYRYCQDHGAGFVANVVLCQYSEPARKLKAIAARLAAGQTVSFQSFSTDQLLVDGYAISWAELTK